MPDDKAEAPRASLSRVPLPPAPKEAQARDSATSAELRADDLIDARYRVKLAIGEGGVGRVYRALQVKLGRDVAVKVLLDAELGDATHRPRFEREAMALAALSHPNIVSVQDYGVWRGQPFLVMEMLEGQSLRQRLDLGPLPEREAFRITRELLHALAYAHSKGVVHRDLKPANVFLQSFPTQLDHVKVLDFGFAKFVDNNALAGAPALTQAGTTMGTPAYVAPERLYGSEVDGRSDLYSVGILLFEMLSGQKPFDGDISAILRAHLSEPVPALSARCPGLGQSQGLTALLERALAKPVEDRFVDAAAMLAALDALERPATWNVSSEARTAPSPPSDEELPTRCLPSGQGPSARDTLRPAPTGARPLRATTQGLQRVARALRHFTERASNWLAPRARKLARRSLDLLQRIAEAGRPRQRGPSAPRRSGTSAPNRAARLPGPTDSPPEDA